MDFQLFIKAAEIIPCFSFYSGDQESI